MGRLSLAALLALTLAACGQDPNRSVSEEYAAADGKAAYAPVPMAPPSPPMESAAQDRIATTGGGSPDIGSNIIQPDPDGGGGGQPAGQRLIAYTYNYGFKVPAGAMQGLLDAHKKQCEDAGPALSLIHI